MYEKILKSELVAKIGNGNNQYTKNNPTKAGQSGGKVGAHVKSLKPGQAAVFEQLDKDGQETGEPIYLTNQGKGKFHAQAGGADFAGSQADVVSWAQSHAKGNGGNLKYYETVGPDGETVEPKTKKSEFAIALGL